MKSILLDEKLLGLVEMTCGLVNASFSLPEWQAVKMIFFAPCSCHYQSKVLPRSGYMTCHQYGISALMMFHEEVALQNVSCLLKL